MYVPGETSMLDGAPIAHQLEQMKWLAQDNLTRSSVQLASDGRWENAFPAESADTGTLRRWLATSGSNVAIESVYCDQGGALKGFFGFRQILESPEERTSFWQAVVEACAAFQSRAPRQQLVSWLDLLGKPSLLEMQPAGTQVGVFNQWLSAGPVTLRGERLDAADMQAGPDWLRNGATAPICREHFWMMPERFWVAEASSVMDGARYRIDPSIVPI
jgi:hypothetical protein